jgi:hypothetical protein
MPVDFAKMEPLKKKKPRITGLLKVKVGRYILETFNQFNLIAAFVLCNLEEIHARL